MLRGLPTLCALGALALIASLPPQARAAESYANCTGFIDAVPAVITTQGVWCLRADLSTAINEGSAVIVEANNVTIDCNDFKLGGLAAGPASNAYGISASGRRNTTVRNCAIRGFNRGISLTGLGAGGTVVEDNRLDGNLWYGILVSGDGTNMVRRNRVYQTGGHPGAFSVAGMQVMGHVLDNTVDGVFSISNNADVRGILLPNFGAGIVASGNRVRSLSAHGDGAAIGIQASSPGTHVINNHVVAIAKGPDDVGIRRTGTNPGFSGGNRVSGFATPYSGTPVGAGPDHSN